MDTDQRQATGHLGVRARAGPRKGLPKPEPASLLEAVVEDVGQEPEGVAEMAVTERSSAPGHTPIRYVETGQAGYAGGSLERVEPLARDGSLTERANKAAANARQIERGLEEIMSRVADVERRPPDGAGSVAVPQSHATFALTEIENAQGRSHDLIQRILELL